MASRVGIVVGGAAIAVGIAWFALRGHGDPDPTVDKIAADDRSGNLTAPSGGASGGDSARGRDGKIDLTTPQRPTAQPVAPAPAMGSEPFEAQRRDDAWAPRTESEIKRRFATGVRAGKLESTECRRDQCLLAVSGTEDELRKTLADLETEGGLLGFADHIILSGPEDQGGRLVVKAYAVFDRKKSDQD